MLSALTCVTNRSKVMSLINYEVILYSSSKSANKTSDTSGVVKPLFSFIKRLSIVHKSQCSFV